jgi:hypothetical protein
MRDSGIAVERKNSGASTVSSSRKGSNDSVIEDQKGIGRVNEVEGRWEERDPHTLLENHRRREKKKPDSVREEWKEHRDDNASRHVDAEGDDNGKEPVIDVTPFEIGVAL